MTKLRIFLSIVLQFIALVLMTCGFMLSGLLPTNAITAAFMLFLLSGIAILLLILAIYLWNKSKWVLLTGVYFLATGLSSVCISYIFRWDYDHGVANGLFAAEINPPLILYSNGCLWLGIVAITVGLSFIFFRYRHSIRAKLASSE